MVSLDKINACKSGGRTAFKEVYEGCAPYIYNVVKRYVRLSADHKDIMQESFARIFSSINTFDPNKGDFKSWIGKITINECFKHHNKTKKVNELKVAYKQESVDNSTESYYSSLTKADIDRLLEKMPEGYKQVFMLTVIDGFTHKEVAKLMGIEAVSSRSQLMRARNWIKKEILSEIKSVKDGTF